MDGFSRYVLRQLLIGTIFVTTALTGVLWLAQSLRFVELIVNRGLSAGTFMYLIMLLLPNYLVMILPIALFTVVVFTYAKLTTDRELVVMRSVGVSPLQLAKPALCLALIVTVIGYALNFSLLPSSYRMFREMQWDLRYNYSHVLLQEGAFNTVTNGVTVYVRERSKDGQLLGIFAHVRRDGKEPETWMADRGALVQGDEGATVVMFNGSRQTVGKNTQQLEIIYFDRASLALDQVRAQDIVRHREPRERTVAELFNIREDRYVAPSDYGKFTIEAHRRLTVPLSSIGFTIVAVVCLMSGRFSRGGQPRAILLAVGIVVTLLLTTMALENLAARDLNLIPTLYIVASLPIAVGMVALTRPSRGRQAGGLAGAAATGDTSEA